MLRLTYNTLSLHAPPQPQQHCSGHGHCAERNTAECCSLKRRREKNTQILLLKRQRQLWRAVFGRDSSSEVSSVTVWLKELKKSTTYGQMHKVQHILQTYTHHTVQWHCVESAQTRRSALIQRQKQSVECWTRRALDTYSSAHVVEGGGATRHWHLVKKNISKYTTALWRTRRLRIFFYIHMLVV